MTRGLFRKTLIASPVFTLCFTLSLSAHAFGKKGPGLVAIPPPPPQDGSELVDAPPPPTGTSEGEFDKLISRDANTLPKAPQLPKEMLEAIANAETIELKDIPAPPPPLPGEVEAPPPPAGVDDQDADGAEEKGKDVSDRTLCPNPSILNTNLVIHHLYIGQGDSTIIRTPGGNLTILIDGGESGHQAEILSALRRCYRTNSVDYVVLTHPHSDHFGGLFELLKHTPEGIAALTKAGKKPPVATPDFQVTRGVYVTGFGPGPVKGGLKDDKALGNKLKAFLEVAQAIDSARMKSGALPKQSNMFLPLGPNVFQGRGAERVKFDVVVVNGETTNKKTTPELLSDKGELKDPNSTSSGIHIKFGTFDYFTSGDISGGGKPSIPPVEHTVVESGLIGKMDVVKANHHGSDTSNSPEFMKLVDPFIYLISAGDAGFNTSSFHLPRLAPVIELHAQVQKKGGFVVQTSCGAGNVMPDHPYCRALQTFDINNEKEKSKGRRTKEFNYLKGFARDPKTGNLTTQEIQGGILNMPNYLNAQGDIVLTTDGSTYFLLVPHNPRPRVAPKFIKQPADEHPEIEMAPETPLALGPFKTQAK